MLEQYNDLLTIDEVCEVLSIGKNRAYELLNSKQIRAFKIGRIWKIPKISLINYITDSCN